MASSSEIEKLERRCAENPHGLTFAPLAEAYRKHGDIDRALDVLRTGRELHPDYIPASIVLGRCHLDRGDLPEAERAFAHVLTLDPENVIALKALADLAEREGRSVQAERWLNLLLAVDPSNEDAQGQLDRIRTGATAELGEPAVLASSVDEAAIGPVAAPEPEVAPEPVAVVEPEPAWAAEAEVGAELEPEAEPVSVAEPEPEPEPEELEPEPALPPHAGQPLPLAMVGGADDDEPDEGHAVMSADGTEEAPVAAEAVVVDITVEREEEIVLTPAPTSDYRGEVAGALPQVNDAEGADELSDPFAEVPDSPDAADDLPDVFDTPRYASYEETEPSDAAASHLEPMPDLMAEFGEAEAFEAHAEPSEPETLFAGGGAGPTPVVTESMAELYLRQGHRAEALEIYRQLAARRPGDARLASVVSGLAAEVDAPPASAPAYAAAQTGGRSVGDLLRGILAERLAAAPPAPEPFPESPDVPEFRSRDEVLADAEDQGEPTRPADDHLTLGAVFGDEDGGAPPAVASPESPSHEQNGGLSFDEFFGAPPAVEPDATRTAPPAPTGDPDDLDQFHAWLQSLKR